jgi:hypothetical protein
MLAFLLSVGKLYSQNVFNPYINYDGDPMPDYTVPLSNFFHSSIIPSAQNVNYNGEYMIQFDQLPWFQTISGSAFGKAKSYKVKIKAMKINFCYSKKLLL